MRFNTLSSALLFSLSLGSLGHAISLPRSPLANTPTLVNLRIEGANHTIYEAPILTSGHNVTTPSGGTHECDGLNYNANPSPGPTCTSALSDAAQLANFTFDGTWYTQYDDFFITRIASSAETSTEFWGILDGPSHSNLSFTPVGGCQAEVQAGNYILWAYDAFDKSYFLALTYSGPKVVSVGQTANFTVTDATSGVVVPNATVTVLGTGEEALTNSQGVASITFEKSGAKVLKATRDDSLRSNAQVLVVV